MAFNPNGNNWVNSDSMGKQLLMKAGWAKGEGIGKNKQGTNVHIKVSIKNEKDGIGFKSQKRENEMSLMQCFTFDNILKSKYGKQENSKNEEKEEEEHNQRSLSRARFGRAVPKDYFKPVQNEELNKIFCKSKSEKQEKIEEIPIENCREIDRNSNFTSSLSVFEYFSLKMKNSNLKISRKFSGYFCEKNEDLQENESKKRKFEEENSSEINKKRKKIIDNQLINSMKKSIKIEADLSNEDINEEISEKKKKKSKKNKQNEETNLSTNEENRINSEENVKKSIKIEVDLSNEEISEEISEKKKKKSKKNKENEEKNLLSTNEENRINPEKNVKKSKKKSKSIEINRVLIVGKEETVSKKKKRKIDIEEIDNKEKKKSKRIDNFESEIERKNEEISISEQVISKRSSVVPSVEIIDNKTIPWDSCNISAIEGYKYY